LIDCFRTADQAFFAFLNALAQLLLRAVKLTDWMVFAALKKGATPERRQKKRGTPTLGATE